MFIPAFELGSGLYGDYPPMNEAGLQMLHDMYLDTGNTTGFWEALQAYKSSSTYRLVYSLFTFSLCGEPCYEGRLVAPRCIGHGMVCLALQTLTVCL